MSLILNFLKKRYVQHIIGWILFLVFMSLSYVASPDMEESKVEIFVKLLQMLAVIMMATYWHFYILKYLINAQYIRYFSQLLVLILGMSFLDVYVFSFIQGPANLESFLRDILNFGVVLLFGAGLKFIKKGIVNQYQIRDLKAKQFETEYNLLKAQVNPHFLFNTLNNMYALSLKNASQLSDMILELSDLMRYQLESSKKTHVKLADELTYLENYVKLEQVRVQKFCKIDFSVSGLPNGKQIAPLLFIPFIENAFKYGISAGKENFISIVFKIVDSKIYFFIENSIPEMTKKQVSTGTGIENVKRRLDILYPSKYLLNITEEANLFSVKLNIEL